MKNLGLFILGIVLGALAMYCYCSDDETELTSPEVIVPKGVITSAQAKTLDQAYNLKHSIINDSLFKGSKTGDNRSSWWPLEDIQNFINYAENQAGKKGYTMDGLRLYLGSYPNSNGDTGLTTLFFIPTGYKNTSEGSMIPFQGGSGDIPSAEGLNKGGNGQPPQANYPQ